jgi:hypothetical protein
MLLTTTFASLMDPLVSTSNIALCSVDDRQKTCTIFFVQMENPPYEDIYMFMSLVMDFTILASLVTSIFAKSVSPFNRSATLFALPSLLGRINYSSPDSLC